jgi:hypothetical protein
VAALWTPSVISILYETTSPLDPISFSLLTPRNRSRQPHSTPWLPSSGSKNRRTPLPATSVLVSPDKPLAKLPLHRSELSCPVHSSMAEGTPAHRSRTLFVPCPAPRPSWRPPASAARGVQPAWLACAAVSRRSSPARMPHRARVQPPHAGSSSARPARFVIRRGRKVRSCPPTPFFIAVCRVCVCHRAVRAPSARCSCVLVAHAYCARSRRSFAGSCTRRASGSHLVCMMFHACKFTCCPRASLFA